MTSVDPSHGAMPDVEDVAGAGLGEIRTGAPSMADTPIGPLLPFGVLDGAYGFGRSTARTPAREIVKPFPEVTVQVTPVVMDWHRNGPSPVALP